MGSRAQAQLWRMGLVAPRHVGSSRTRARTHVPGIGRQILFLINLFYLFIYFWLRWVFIAACGLSLVVASGGHPSLRCTGLSPRWPLPLRSTGCRRAGLSSCGSRAPEHRLSSCGARAQPLHGMWDPPGPGLEPASPALAGGLPTTAPPEKPRQADS